jgi:hypothetical protein
MRRKVDVESVVLGRGVAGGQRAFAEDDNAEYFDTFVVK